MSGPVSSLALRAEAGVVGIGLVPLARHKHVPLVGELAVASGEGREGQDLNSCLGGV